MRDDLYQDLACAYVRGMYADLDSGEPADLLRQGAERGLKLHRFKRTMGLPRVRAVLGALHGMAPQSLVDVGSGRGVFLWPLLDAFPSLPITAVEPDGRRAEHLEAVRRGGVDRLSVVNASLETAGIEDGAADVVSVLEVLEHQDDPRPLAEAAIRIATRFVLASVPSKEDDNPEHVQLFTGETLSRLLKQAGARSVNIDYVPGHIVAVARVG